MDHFLHLFWVIFQTAVAFTISAATSGPSLTLTVLLLLADVKETTFSAEHTFQTPVREKNGFDLLTGSQQTLI